MKKNFMAIASLLIAAMLLVVSCSQEIAPKDDNNGLVKASLSVGYGRDLKVTGDTDSNGLTLKYKMTAKWSNPTSDTENLYEAITNPASDWTPLPADGTLGWVTPGYWQIDVQAIGTDNGVVFSGSVNSYFTNRQTSAVVFLQPAGTSENCSITITVDMQDIKVGSTPYTLQYDILDAKGASIYPKDESNNTKKDLPSKTSGNNVTTYEATKGSLSAGFYTVVVYVHDETGAVVGGIRKGFLLTDGDTATVTGHIEPSDYENVSINAIYVDVNLELTEKAQSKTDDKYVVTITAKDLTSFENIPAKEDAFTVTYIWMVDGDVKEQISNPTKDGVDVELSFAKPGHKNIACQAVYKSKTNDTVYFTETDSISVFVDPTVSQSNS